MDRRLFLNRTALLILGGALMDCDSGNKIHFRNNQVIACFGDSITASESGYVSMLQDTMDKNHPDLELTFLNYGKSSETVTGLTEKVHPGPRPYLFERLDALMEETPIDVALFCYGINCGIYGEPSPALFDSYKIGVFSFLEKMRKYNTRVVLMTPPPLTHVLQHLEESDNREAYGYLNPYPHYDREVLQKFSAIIQELEHPSILGKIDIRTPLLQNRQTCYTDDPIHPNKNGHKLIARTIIDHIGF